MTHCFTCSLRLPTIYDFIIRNPQIHLLSQYSHREMCTHRFEKCLPSWSKRKLRPNRGCKYHKYLRGWNKYRF